MMRKTNNHSIPVNRQVWEALRDTVNAVHYDLTDLTVQELRLRLHTPGIFALYKADIPTPGLPMLDGFLKFLAFRYAVAQVMASYPNLSNELLWQWNAALHGEGWIEFPIPICEEELSPTVTLFDCSVGLPVTQDGDVLYPAGAFFSNGIDFVTYPSENYGVVDQISLRRRSVKPFYRPLKLKGVFKSSQGPTKALDNRIYYALTYEYLFYFRGNKESVETLLDFAIQHNIGLGKKTTLGYGQLADFSITKTNRTSTLAQPLDIGNLKYLALLKNIPQLEVRRRCIRKEGHFVPLEQLQPNEWEQNKNLFSAEQISLASPIETYDRYQPPYWRQEGRTQVFRYGTLLIPRRQ